jgi:sporulation protein YlmC with PRC-barrel domain
MPSSINEFIGYSIQATDGEIGTIRDFLFDDEAMSIRHIVVRSGSWLAHRDLLISPISIEAVITDEKTIAVALTKRQIESSPDIETGKTVSRQMEAAIFDHYNWPYYWGGSSAWGMPTYPGLMATSQNIGQGRQYALQSELQKTGKDLRESDVHLRSVKEILGYRIKGSDKPFGRIDDIFVDAATWHMRYLVLNLDGRLIPEATLIPIECVKSISWADREFHLSRTEGDVQNAPQLRSRHPLNREAEKEIYEYYGRSGYWENGPTPKDGHIRRIS